MLLDLLIFGLAAWLLGTLVRVWLFRREPAPAWLAWLSAIAIFALAFAGIYWGQQESFRLYMESLFGPNYHGRPFRPQPPIFTSFAIAGLWFAALRGTIRFPSFGRKGASTEQAAPPAVADPAAPMDTSSEPLWTPPPPAAAPPAPPPRPKATLRWIIGGAVALAALIGVGYLFNPYTGPLAQSREQCVAEQTRGATSNAELAAAQRACEQRRTEVELRCNTPLNDDATPVEARLYTHRYGHWEVQMYNPYSNRTLGRFTVRIRFSDNSARNYDVALSEPLRPRQAGSGYFEPMGIDRQKAIGAWDFVDLTSCY